MTESETENARDASVRAFIESLGKLDAGERARMKRNAGHSLAEARDVLGLFYRMLPTQTKPYEYERYFLIATLFPLGTVSRKDRNFGATLRLTRMSVSGPALDRRVEALLEADAEQLPFRLRQAIRLAQSHRVGINWTRLLVDVLAWDAPSRYVQQQWAQTYFRAQSLSSSANDASRV